MTHTKEPWHTGYGLLEANIYDQDGHGVAYAMSHMRNAVANARRIVDCVNACAGLETELLIDSEGAAPKSLLDAVTHYKQQRDELLALLRRARDGVARHGLRKDIDAAIAKAEGKV